MGQTICVKNDDDVFTIEVVGAQRLSWSVGKMGVVNFCARSHLKAGWLDITLKETSLAGRTTSTAICLERAHAMALYHQLHAVFDDLDLLNEERGVAQPVVVVQPAIKGECLEQRSKYTFYVDPLGFDVSVIAADAKTAYKAAFASLTPDQQDATCILDLLDEERV